MALYDRPDYSVSSVDPCSGEGCWTWLDQPTDPIDKELLSSIDRLRIAAGEANFQKWLKKIEDNENGKR